MEAPLKDCTTLEQRVVIRFLNAEGIQTSQICQRMKNIYNLAPSDYFLFGLLKKELKGKRFDSDEDVQKVVQEFFHTLPKSAYKEGIYKFPERWRRCIESQERLDKLRIEKKESKTSELGGDGESPTRRTDGRTKLSTIRGRWKTLMCNCSDIQNAPTKRTGRKRTANRNIIKYRLQRNSKVSMRKFARETGISKSSVHRIANRISTSRCTSSKRISSSRMITSVYGWRDVANSSIRATGQRLERIQFTDEKLFPIEQAHNHQMDRSWSAEAPDTSAIAEHRQNPQSVIVWAGIRVSDKTPSLVFVDQGVKINQEVYRLDILEAFVLSWS
ncbi:hypothetical protein LAZ67_6002781 [Cordylochernes scorpioides]|uniref:Mos1 transposase HTH domain-containing protein n=1 Tax=Cordylochernes scorpioides TaxID=51811 RepID=A0ABY6KMZ9_9ARAC|nr:hypothetical protein LAZ67_6002781 [Cordylochernes scorpioides]